MPEYPQVTDISSHSNYPNSWSDLFAMEDGKEYVLIAGPGIAEWPCIENDQYASCYLARLLDGMIKWCVQENIIDQSDTIEDFHRLLQGKSLVHVGYKIEEYLVDRPQLRQCLQEVLHHQTRLWEMHRCLARLPFRGYITTTYDTFIETAYSQIKQSRLSKFYTSSIHDAIVAYRNDSPFILKLYGDIDNPDSLILARRLTKGLSVIGEQDQLHTLLSMSSVLFVGFEKTDPDFEVLSSIVKGTYVSREDFISWMISNEQPHKLRWESKSGAIISYQPSQIDAAVPVLSKTLLPPKTIESDLQTERTSRNKPSQQMQRAPAPSTTEDSRPIEVFTAYAYSDEELKKRIDYILSTLRKQGWNLSYHWSEVARDAEWREEDYVDTANLILLLISQEFIASDFCYNKQILRAIARHRQKDACYIVPILLRPATLWRDTAFGHLPFLPKSGQPVSRCDLDDAFDEIATYIKGKLDILQHYI